MSFVLTISDVHVMSVKLEFKKMMIGRRTKDSFADQRGCITWVVSYIGGH